MTLVHALVAALAAAALTVVARADDAQQPPKPKGGEPAVQHIVVEDEGVRIEELRVRGQTQRITVHSKVGNARPYEIVPPTGARDPSQQGNLAGQRLWHMFSF
jgi:hypothetical protein